MAALLLITPHRAFSYGYKWDISSFNTDITAFANGTLNIKETIVADYSNESHHGIYRTIPIKYPDGAGNKLILRYKVNSVTDQNGNAWPYEKSIDGDNLKLQIGYANILQNKPTTFIIDYEITRAISFQFPDHDEIYWNATGTEWPVPIQSASAKIHLPSTTNESDIRATCYSGSYGSVAQGCEYNISENEITYTSKLPLNSYENLTIVAGFPKDIIEKPALTKQIIWFLTDNWPYVIPLFTFLTLLYLWFTRGRDPKTNKTTIMPIYKAPTGLTPAEAGTIIDEKVDMRDISSTIIDMAVRGYMKIIETKKKNLLGVAEEYKFEKLKEFENDPSLRDHEKKTLKAIFGSDEKKDLNDLKNKFYKDIPEIRKAIYDEMIKEKYFPQSPDGVRNTYIAIGFSLIFFPFFIFGLFITIGLIAIPLASISSGIIIIAFAKHMPAKTTKGVEMYYKVLGLEEFINTAEKDRIKFQEKENIFMELLPYAMALNIADKWSKAFEGLNKTPDWYQSSDPDLINNFSAYYFINRLNSMSQQMNTAFTSAPRSSSSSSGSWSGGSGFGGGFSGGGFGGGGGGSW